MLSSSAIHLVVATGRQRSSQAICSTAFAEHGIEHRLTKPNHPWSEKDKGFHVSVSFVIKLLQRWRESETVEPTAFGGHKTSALSAHADRVRALVASEPEATIDDLRERLFQEGVQAGRSAIGRCLLGLGLTRKKRHRAPENRIVRT